MRLFGWLDGTINQHDRAGWLTPPFNLVFIGGELPDPDLRLFGKVDGIIDRKDRAGWITPPFPLAYASSGDEDESTGGLLIGDWPKRKPEKRKPRLRPREEDDLVAAKVI